MIMTDNLTVSKSTSSTLLNDVINALGAEFDIGSESILSFENVEKYSNTGAAQDPHALEIFHKLCEINQVGVSEKNLCRNDSGQGYSFRESLDGTISALASILQNKRVVYVELGPEPVKTELILHGISEKSELAAYICVDINASSRDFMTAHVSSIISPAKVKYLLSDYREISKSHIIDVVGGDCSDCTFVVASLGSQEGNEHPKVMHSVYESLMGVGDLLLSEMQILPTYNHHPIFAFSHHPLWVAVSKAHVNRMLGDVSSSYGTVMVSLSIPDVGPVKCAVAVERVRRDEFVGVDVFLSNYCLKYKIDQIRELRSKYGFHIEHEAITGDGSVAFHILTLLGSPQ